MELNRTDYIILKLLKKKKCTSFFEGMTLQEIMDVTQTTRPTTYRKMMNMKEMDVSQFRQIHFIYLIKESIL